MALLVGLLKNKNCGFFLNTSNLNSDRLRKKIFHVLTILTMIGYKIWELSCDTGDNSAALDVY